MRLIFRIELKFTRAISGKRGFGYGVSQGCQGILVSTAKLGENPCCYWSMDGTIVRITLGSMADVRAGDELSINPSLLRTDSANSWSSKESSVKIALDAPEGFLGRPSPRVRAPSIYSVGCGDLTLDVSPSVGGYY
jgi:hypothetical protein